MKINTLTITDLDKLQITKIKPFALYFTYDGERYMLHESSDGYYGYIALYKRILNKYGSAIKVEYLSAGHYGLDSVYDVIRPIQLKSSSIIKLGIKLGCYKLIDKEYFVRKLTEYGFIYSLY